MATNPNRLAGVCYVTVDGQSYAMAGKGTYGVSGVKRESLSGQDGVHGFKEMPVPGFIGFTARDASNALVAALQNATNATVQMELANGKIIIGRNMWRAGDGPIEVDTEEATLDVRFESADVTEN